MKMKSVLLCALIGTIGALGAMPSADACGKRRKPPPPPEAEPETKGDLEGVGGGGVVIIIESFESMNFVETVRGAVVTPTPLRPRKNVIIRYRDTDGGFLLSSNGMPLPPSQGCACAVSFPNIPGVSITGVAFAQSGSGGTLPQNVSGYDTFTPENALAAQIKAFADVYAEAAGDIPSDNLFRAFSFYGAEDGSTVIPSDVEFDLFVRLSVPANLNVNQLLSNGEFGSVSLYLIDNGQVFIEPNVGMTPMTLNQWASGDMTDGAMAKTETCPESAGALLSDLNGDGRIDSTDMSMLLGAWGTDDVDCDLNGDGIVDAQDLSVLLSVFGSIVDASL